MSVTRLTVAGTVEDRILALQDRKQQLASRALGDDDQADPDAAGDGPGRTRLNNLSMQDLHFLFAG